MRSLPIRGFTLIEMLLAVALLSMLAAVVIVAINPSRQFQTTRDSQRETDVFSIMNALHQFALNNEGAFPSTLGAETREICRTENDSCDGLYDLSALTEDQRYLIALPLDPQCIEEGNEYCDANGTGYFIATTQEGSRIWLSAENAETRTIEVTK